MKQKQILKSVFIIFLSTICLNIMPVSKALAVTTVPHTINYQGRITNPSGAKITTPLDIRFSFWSDADVNPADFGPGNIIKTTEPTFSGYQELQTVTPDSDGLFSVQIGSVTSLPDFVFTTHKFLQVEIKNSGAPLTAFEVLDPDGDATADTFDRKPISEFPFASNADLLDNADVGLAQGDVALLSTLGKWMTSQIPDGTDENQFIIDANDDAPGDVILRFGTAAGLNQFLKWDATNTNFFLSNDLNINGLLTSKGAVIGDTANNFTISPTGTVTLNGTARVLKRIKLSLRDFFRKGVKAFTSDSAGMLLRFDAASNDQLVLNIPVPSDYAGGNITAELIWNPRTGGTVGDTVKWDLDYQFLNPGDNPTTKPATTVSATSGVVAINSLQTDTLTLAGGVSTDKVIAITLQRNSKGTGSDTYSKSVDLFSVSLEYLSNRLGN